MLGFNGGLLGKERRLIGGALAGTGLWLPNEQSVAIRAGNVGAFFALSDTPVGTTLEVFAVDTLNDSATLQLLVTPVDFF